MAVSGISVDVRGIAGVQAMLGKWDDKNARKVLRSALRSGGGIVKKATVAEAPYPDLKENVWARTSSRKGQIGFVIGHHKHNGGFIWHMVAGGTKTHGPRKAKALVFYSKGRYVVTSSVRGVTANPFVARAYARSEAAAVAKVSEVIDKYLDSA